MNHLTLIYILIATNIITLLLAGVYKYRLHKVIEVSQQLADMATELVDKIVAAKKESEEKVKAQRNKNGTMTFYYPTN